MTTSTLTRTLLAALAAGSALALAGACGGLGGDGSGRAFQHATKFVVSGSHQGFTCDKCHDPAAPSYALAGGGVSCLGCHQDAAVTPRHASVAGFAWDDAHCIGCHKDGTGGLPPNHDAQLFPITGTKHLGVACGQCHGPTKAPADLTCIPCHVKTTMDAKHSAIPASTTGGSPAGSGATRTSYQYLSTACVRCHADGQVNPIAQHPSTDGGFNNQRHRPFCLTCHQASRATGDKPWGADFKAFSCLDCHTSNQGGGG